MRWVFRLPARFVPWWLLRWIDDHSTLCWARIVGWKVLDDDNDIGDGESCRAESRHPKVQSCYCGKFQGGAQVGRWGKSKKVE